MKDLEIKINQVYKSYTNGDISSEVKNLIISHLRLQDKFYSHQIKMADKFKEIVNPTINSANSMEDLQKVKEFLRVMPDCADKVFIFHSILLKEETLKNQK